ncbi:ABC1 kinase family protein [Fluviicola taffensis]|uniref:ABC-1 domain-containing protein n=1 Tax=Fluviicola taffensis (strain DSM 16823 / NCIMB 13979 / RW262) TaxID=755732 RepID=F2IBY9_FLUTR|nr:AarF/ABC1/UbiB kinase family protein [Fluviicola taffensis]AEA42217.1 ABC-1 domain-containing protein [Fluviicola taffensis DSM 16823]
MWIFRFSSNLKNFFRLLSIIRIILGHYISNWLTTGPLRFIFDPRGKNRKTRSERLRLIIEDLGPTFIKFGQIVADRPDIASEGLRTELKKLQSSARPMPDDIAIQIIENEIGASIDTVFSEFNEKHIASASIGQVYTATLITGEKVVLKVQRPNIRNKIRLDIKLLQIFARKIQAQYPEISNFNLITFIEDFGEIMLKELDFMNELSNMMRFTNMFKDDDRVYVPKVYSKYSTSKLLIMEYIVGEAPDNLANLVTKGYDPKIIAENGVNIILTMILKHGFFHADPHAGNMFIRGNNQLVLIDFGMCASLKPKQIDGLIDFLIGFSDKNPHKIAKALLKLTEVENLRELESLEFEIRELNQKYAFYTYDDVDISGLFTDTFKLLMKYGISIPSSLYMLLKTLVTIQKVAESLQVKLDLIGMVKPYAKDKIKERFGWKSIKSKLVSSAEDYLYLVESLPKDIKTIVTNFKEGGLQHNIKLGETGNTIGNTEIRRHIYRFGSIMLLGMLLICATLLKIFNVKTVIYKNGKPIMQEAFGNFPDVFFVTTVVISVFVVLRLMFRAK